MKRLLGLTALIAVILAFETPAQAQKLRFGLRAGVNTSRLDYDGWNKDDICTGMYFGPMVDLSIPLGGLGADGSVLIAKRGGDDWKQTGIEVPLNLKYNIDFFKFLGIYFAVGPDFFFSFSDLKDGWDKTTAQVGLNLGGGVKVIKHIVVNVNYQIPFSTAFKGSNGDGKLEKTWQAGLAYIF